MTLREYCMWRGVFFRGGGDQWQSDEERQGALDAMLAITRSQHVMLKEMVVKLR